VITPEPEGALYRRLAARLRAQITSGELQPGQRFPSEKDLVDGFGVSRDTARKAVAILRSEGMIVVRHGYPTRVRSAEAEVETVKVMRGSELTIRAATESDQRDLGVGDGRAVAVLVDPAGKVRVFVADRSRFTFA
jgi:DNA-binding GntR family transcriptional regulator